MIQAGRRVYSEFSNEGGRPRYSHLYVHVPFCSGKCIYCPFYSIPIGRAVSGVENPVVGKYVEGVKKEVESVAGAYKLQDGFTLYFGGGTPSRLPLHEIKALFSVIGTLVEGGARSSEVTFELNPEDANRALISLLRELGVTRVSFGIQTLDDEALSFLGRRHDARQALVAVELAKDEGLDVSTDLIIGVPGLSSEDVERDVKALLDEGVDHLSVYMLELHEGTPLERMVSRGTVKLWEEDEVTLAYEKVREEAERRGLLPYEVSNFAKPGKEARHNVGYWRRENYLGLGPAAVSQVGNVRMKNVSSMSRWYASVERFGFLPQEVELIGEKTAEFEFFMLGLRTRDGVAIERIRTAARRFVPGRSEEDFEVKFALLAESGLVELKNERIRLTKRGFPLANAVIGELFGWLL